jgi:glycosyltransferase involved in cell wall biosynthesis
MKLHVHYLAEGHADRRHWRGHAVDDHYETTVWRDVGIRSSRREIHLNPGVIAHFLNARVKWLMVGGPWDSLTGAAISLAGRADNAIAWFEGNSHTPGRNALPVRLAKKALLARYKYWAVPGAEGIVYAGMVGGRSNTQKCRILPNIVDEGRFNLSAEVRRLTREEWKVPPAERMAIWPARLVPEKGIVPFLESLEREFLKGWTIRIIGDGPLRQEISDTLKRLQIEQHVALVPSVPYDRMPALYRAADLFILPSLHDPNPLSVVEAMHSGLPILISDRVGNFPEALRQGVNGWGFDPAKKENVRAATAAALTATNATLQEAGEASREVARSGWSSEDAVARFIRSIGIAR